MYKLITSTILILILSILFFPISYSTNNSFIWTEDTSSVSTTPSTNLELESASAILIEQNSGKILYEHNSHEQLRPASVTKVMSILLIMEALDSNKISLTDKVPCSENASNMGGSQIWLDVREELTVDEMLKAICVASANEYDVQKQQEKSSHFSLIFGHFFMFF